MSERLRRNAAVIQALHKATPKARKQLLKACLQQGGCRKDLIDCFSDIAKNIISGNIKLRPHHLKALRRRRKAVRLLASKKTSLAKKKALLSQTGGFLGSLLTPIISVLGGLLGNIFNK